MNLERDLRPRWRKRDRNMYRDRGGDIMREREIERVEEKPLRGKREREVIFMKKIL